MKNKEKYQTTTLHVSTNVTTMVSNRWSEEGLGLALRWYNFELLESVFYFLFDENLP